MKIKTKKEYCVHITLCDYIMENIMAKTPAEAKRIATKRWELEAPNFVCESQEIANMEIMQVCHCGWNQATDNDIINKVCDNCGKKL
jgi:hypothetical protein